MPPPPVVALLPEKVLSVMWRLAPEPL